MLTTLEYTTDELTSATHTVQTLLTDFGLVCENAEMDGKPIPTDFTDKERKRLKKAIISTREALKQLESLEVSDE